MPCTKTLGARANHQDFLRTNSSYPDETSSCRLTGQSSGVSSDSYGFFQQSPGKSVDRCKECIPVVAQERVYTSFRAPLDSLVVDCALAPGEERRDRDRGRCPLSFLLPLHLLTSFGAPAYHKAFCEAALTPRMRHSADPSCSARTLNEGANHLGSPMLHYCISNTSLASVFAAKNLVLVAFILHNTVLVFLLVAIQQLQEPPHRPIAPSHSEMREASTGHGLS